MKVCCNPGLLAGALLVGAGGVAADLSAVPTGASGTVALAWDAVGANDTYLVYASSELQGDTSALSFTVTGLPDEVACEFSIAVGNSTAWTAEATPFQAVDAAPDSVAAAATGDYGELFVSWAAVPGATYYTVAADTTTTALSVTLEGLADGTAYNVSVAGGNSGGSGPAAFAEAAPLAVAVTVESEEVQNSTVASPFRATHADVNGDGADDLVVVSFDSGTVAFYLSPSWEEVVVSSALSGAFDVAVADLNADGALDLVVPSSTSNVLYLVWGLDGGDVSSIALAGAPVGVLVEDMDGDGTLDVLYSLSTGDAVGRYIPLTAGGQPTDISGDGPEAPYFFDVGDVDGDGTLDVAVPCSGSGELRLYSTGALGANATQALAAGSSPRSARAADVDGDGDVDVVVTAYASGEVLYFGNAGGLLLPAVVVSGSQQEPWGLLLVDLDRSGTLDVVVAAESAVAWYSGDGNGTFGAQQTLASTNGTASVTALGADDLAYPSTAASAVFVLYVDAPPATPGAVAAAGESDTSVLLSWNGSTNASNVFVYVDGAYWGSAPGSASSVEVTDLEECEAYAFSLAGQNARGVGQASAAVEGSPLCTSSSSSSSSSSSGSGTSGGDDDADNTVVVIAGGAAGLVALVLGGVWWRKKQGPPLVKHAQMDERPRPVSAPRPASARVELGASSGGGQTFAQMEARFKELEEQSGAIAE